MLLKLIVYTYEEERDDGRKLLNIQIFVVIVLFL